MPSSTPPTEEALRSSQRDASEYWNHGNPLKSQKPVIIGNIFPTTQSGGHQSRSPEKSHTGKATTDQNHNIEIGKQGDGDSVEGRMNTNGFGRGAMTGSRTTSGDSLGWISDVPVTQAARGHHMSHTSVAGHTHEPHLMHPAGPRGDSGLYRPQATEASRVYGQYHQPIYTTTCSSGLPPYSPSLYGQSGQSSLQAASLYGAFYQQYAAAAHGYSHSSLLSGHFPQVESYSAVLATMGSHVQHAQSQLPRSPFIPQYGPSSANSPGPSVPRPLTPGQHPMPHAGLDPLQRDSKSPKLEPRDFRPSRVASPPKDSRLHPHGHYSPSHSGIHRTSMLREPPKFDFSSREALGKSSISLPPGPEMSQRLRIMAQRGELLGESTSFSDQRHSHLRPEENPAKRQRGSPPPKSHTHATTHTPGHLPPIPPGGLPGPYPHYPAHFTKGSIIQLANGELKRVEDLRTDDFVQSAEVSPDLKIDSSTVVKIEESPERGTTLLGFSVGEHRIQVTVEAMMEHPFFVFGQGWSSCSPDRTMHRYGLACQKLSVGDVCISLTHKDASQHLALQVSQASPSGPSLSQASSKEHTVPSSGNGKTELHGTGSSSRDITSTCTSRVEIDPRIPTPSQHGGSAPPAVLPREHSDPQSSAHSTQVQRPGVILPRKRRWSAPDHLRTDADIGVDPTSQVPSTSGPQGQGHEQRR